MTDKEKQQVINKAYHLLQSFDYDFLKKKDIIPLECGSNVAGTMDYILVRHRNVDCINYRFDRTYDSWKMTTILINDKEA